MVNIKENGIKFEHLVVFEDNQVYARARDLESRRVRLFLVNEQTGGVYSRNKGSWEEIYGIDRSFVVSNIYTARHNRSIPVYTLPRTSFTAFGA